MALNFVLYLALRAAALLLPLLPLRASYRLAWLVGQCAYFLVPSARHGIASNLAVILNRSPSSPTVRSKAREAFSYDAKNWVDTLRIGRLTPDDLSAAVTIQGRENLVNALKLNKGVIIVSLHLGNFDLVGQVLAASGHRLTIPVEVMRPRRLFDFLLRQRVSLGINAIPLDRAAKELIQTLRRGDIVGIIGDRNIGGRGVDVEFFGRIVSLPRVPASLNRRTGAPVLVGVGVRLPSNRFEGIFTPPLAMVRTESSEADIRRNTRTIAASLETFISRYPEQWLAFSPLWSGSAPDVKATASMGDQTEVRV